MSGTCGTARCTFYEDNCLLHFLCGTAEGSGALDGNAITFNGNCSGTITGGTMAGTCGSCSFTMQRN